MKCTTYKIPGICILLKEEKNSQTQGLFEKFYDYDEISACGIRAVFSTHFEMKFPKQNILRGFYIQDAPLIQTLMFKCVKGSCKIVLLDMREQFPTFRQHISFVLDGQEDSFLYFEAGIAYAILSLEDDTVLYCFSSNSVSESTNIIVNAFDDVFKDEWPDHGIIASTRERTAPRISQLPHNYW